MSLNDLFTIVSSTRLSSDTSSWGDQIISALLSRHPKFSSLVGDVVFSKVKPIEGYGIGYIILIGRAQRIPFIINKCELDPLDVYIDNSMYLPLSENAAECISRRSWPFKLISQAERGTIVKIASSLYEDTGSLKDDFISKHHDELNKIASVYPEIIEKYAQKPDVTSSESPYISRFFIKEAADNKPVTQRTPGENDKHYKFSEIKEKFGQDFITKLMTEKNLYITNMAPTVTLELDKREIHDAYKPTRERVGYLKTTAGLIPAKVYERHRMSNLSYASKYIITKDGQFLRYRENALVNKASVNGNDTVFSIGGAEPVKKDDVVVLIFGDKVFGPIQINSIAQFGNGKVVTATDDELIKIAIRFTDQVKTIIQLDRYNYLVNPALSLVAIKPLKETELKYDSPLDFVKKASVKITVSKLLNGKLSIDDGGVSGLSVSSLKNLSKEDAITILMKCGLTERDAKYALMRAIEVNSFQFDAPVISEKKEIVKDKNVEKIAEEITDICEKSDLLKIAGVSGDESNIDLALGLNLITYDNVKRYKLLSPKIYEMLDKLCKLLFLKRMNRQLFPIEESKLVSAIFSLDEIAYKLNSI